MQDPYHCPHHLPSHRAGTVGLTGMAGLGVAAVCGSCPSGSVFGVVRSRGNRKNTPKDAPRREGMQLLSREEGKWVHLLVLTSAPFRFPTYLIVCDFGVDYSRSFVC